MAPRYRISKVQSDTNRIIYLSRPTVPIIFESIKEILSLNFTDISLDAVATQDNLSTLESNTVYYILELL